MRRLLYYDVLGYLPENRALLEIAFEVVRLPHPGFDTDTVLAGLEACCAPLGFAFDGAKMDRAPGLRAILSNTTGVPHIDMAAAARALGCRAWSVGGDDALTPVLAEALAGDGPALIDVTVDPSGYAAQFDALRG